MTRDEIKSRVQEIVDAADDMERAHSLEDDLYYDFVTFVSQNERTNQFSLAIMALEVLETKKVRFKRACA
jgi:hypothetical protein